MRAVARNLVPHGRATSARSIPPRKKAHTHEIITSPLHTKRVQVGCLKAEVGRGLPKPQNQGESMRNIVTLGLRSILVPTHPTSGTRK